MRQICVTGADGFIGKSICKALIESNTSVRGLVRDLSISKNLSNIEFIPIGDIGIKKNFKDALVGVDCVIHCAGRTHVMNETKVDALKIYRSVNVNGTKQIAEQAAEAGVKRLVFLSSVKVNGEDTLENYRNINLNNKKKYIFTHNDVPNPANPYAISKFEAEQELWNISLMTGLEVTIIRLPLVYGYGVKGNFSRLIQLVQSGIPLPLGGLQNQRSLIGIDNLIDLLTQCINHPEAGGKTFLVSDGVDLSTPDLLNHIASAMGCSARLFPVPRSVLKLFGFIIRKQSEMERLIGSLRVDINYTKKILNWRPPVSVEDSFKRMFQSK